MIGYSATGDLAWLNLYTGRKITDFKTEPGRMLEIFNYKMFISAGNNNVVKLWDNTQNKLLSKMVGPANCTALKALDTSSFLVGYANGQLIQWNLSGQEIMVAILGNDAINQILIHD